MSDVNKAALNYLHASGAVPICIVETEGVCKFALKADPAALVTFWTHQEGSALLKAVRTLAGKSCPDVATATEALQRAAVHCRVNLTPHETAMGRADAGAKNLDVYMETMRKNGQLTVS